MRKEHAPWQRVCEANIREIIVVNPEGWSPSSCGVREEQLLELVPPVSGLPCQPAQFLSEAPSPRIILKHAC